MHLRRFWFGLGIAYSLFILYGTLFPFTPYQPFPPEAWKSLREVWLTSQANSSGDLIQNLLLFIPLGYFLGKLLSPSGRHPLRGLLVSVTLGASLSFSVEYLQLYFPDRMTSVMDWILNSVSTALGVTLSFFLRFPKPLRPAKRIVRIALQSRSALPALACVFLTVLELWQPFNFSLENYLLVGKWNSLFSNPFDLQAYSYWLLARQLALFAVTAAFCIQWAREQNLKFPNRWVLGILMFLAICLELGQGVLISRQPVAVEALASCLGVVLGIALQSVQPQRNPIALIFFWVPTGILASFAFSFSPSLTLDAIPLQGNNMALVAAPVVGWVSSIVHALSIFAFVGFVITYLIARPKLFKKTEWVQRLAFGVIGFILGTIGQRQGNYWPGENWWLASASAFLLGAGLCWWALACFRDYFLPQAESANS